MICDKISNIFFYLL